MPGLIERPSFGEAIALDPYWADGLVGAWFMNEGRYSPIVYDASGNGNDGVLTGMDPATDWGLGEDGWALKFGGQGSGEYVDCGSHESLDITEELTIALFSNPSSNDLFMVARANGSAYQYGLYNDYQQLSLYYGANHNTGTTTGINTDGAWHLYAVTVDASAVTFWRDDYFEAKAPISLVSQAGAPFQIGARDGAFEYGADIGDLYVWSRALSATEIRTLHETRGNCLLARPDYGWLYGAQVPGFQELAGALSGDGDLAGVMLVDKALAGELSANGDLAGSMLVDKVLAGVLCRSTFR